MLKTETAEWTPPTSSLVFSSFMVAGWTVPDKLRFLIFLSLLAVLSHRYSNSRLTSRHAEPKARISEDFSQAGMLPDSRLLLSNQESATEPGLTRISKE